MFKNICWVNWLFTIMIAVLAVISISSALSGCGNKGALYLPDSSSQQPSTPVQKKSKKIRKSTNHGLL
jgi:predicted small lipoprotein YifL